MVLCIVIGGNGYTICSGSYDKTIRIWDIETTKELNVLKGHEKQVRIVKYVFVCVTFDLVNKHISPLLSVEYSPFVIKNINGSSNVICSGSIDNIIRFWDIRLCNQLHMIKANNEENGIICLKFFGLKQKENVNDIKLCYGSHKGNIKALIFCFSDSYIIPPQTDDHMQILLYDYFDTIGNFCGGFAVCAGVITMLAFIAFASYWWLIKRKR
ncbi:hypothetical protein RFI_20765 [Reticulomyxa filosa]|uniref:Uncharacterized protein n=1 Tax=Reticulomyxa filosa TaxID=46433 RepID=X6MTW6_RETFI|nr:hypothetical protein RFI_20765 [Reticulomyxa filosa]|eukprot:ETO16570.1 hypothetical protein RFI_20765 [Reticulomyxa filosa]